ncbi:flavodoxin family protein [Natranaerobius thermophilus]|uniref:NADPH-dependent FMN reductase n=1 Tax=Natranaerobius thermophilus (strain ATCC BAA-1301 / DSM 18059 / JW/NM-WN-LF) TaxID=457570 RepID=B2A438_NATTJ|nr:flavodoxin family protein [Natranaerobius thermophilus]ACB85138.1 NADPH-dependent FMN reductase [Natranaerobius thermophilus JW/NM-WN-LF]
MKILGVVGSKRKNGNTSILVQEALKPFESEDIETELIYIDNYNFRGCNGCEGCQDTYKCVIDDDMQKIYPKITASDAIILGSPAYFYNVSGDMKTFIDRLYCFEAFSKDDRSVWMSINEVLGVKYAAVVAVCEQKKVEDMGYTAEVLEKSLEALSYRVVSSVKAINLFSTGEASKDEKALKEAKVAGEKLLKTLELRQKIAKQLNN